MKRKILNAGLVLASLMGYLEWGKNDSMFLFQAEGEILRKLFSDPVSVFHPFVLLPLFGQILLVVTLFQKEPSKVLSYIAIGAIGILLLFMFVISLLGLHYRILFSTVPFLILAVLAIREHRRKQ